MIYKLQNKVLDDAKGQVLKAINNESKVLYKYRDIEDLVVNGIAIERIVRRLYTSDPVRSLMLWANQSLNPVKIEVTKRPKPV